MKNILRFITFMVLNITSLMVQAKAMTLPELWQEALQTYPSITEAEASIEAKTHYKQAIASADQPQVGLKSELSYAWMAKDFPRTANQLKASYPLYQPDISERIDQADAQLQQSIWALEAQKQTLRWNIAQAFYGILKLATQKTYFKKQYQDLKTTLKQVQQRYEVGYQNLNDIAEIQARMDQNQANLLAVQEKQLQMLTSLNQYLSHPVTLKDLKETSLSFANTQPVDFQQHPLLKALGFKQQALLEQQAIVKHQDGIKVQAFGAYIYNDSQGHFYDDMQGLKGGIEVNIPIYLGGRTAAKQAQFKSKSQMVLAQMDQKQRLLKSQYQQAKLGIKLGKARLKSLESSLRSNQQALKATEQGLKTGTRNILDLLNAQNRVYKAEESIPLVKRQMALDQIKMQWSLGLLTQ